MERISFSEGVLKKSWLEKIVFTFFSFARATSSSTPSRPENSSISTKSTRLEQIAFLTRSLYCKRLAAMLPPSFFVRNVKRRGVLPAAFRMVGRISSRYPSLKISSIQSVLHSMRSAPYSNALFISFKSAGKLVLTSGMHIFGIPSPKTIFLTETTGLCSMFIILL